MNWKTLDHSDTINEIKEISGMHPVLIFKHSTRCSISSMALNRLERDWKEDEMQQMSAYFLDLVRHRDVSNAVADTFDVNHQSPQVLIIKDGECIYDTSHMGISYQEIRNTAGEVS
jgi:bacillithiol system protein YtxJ